MRVDRRVTHGASEVLVLAVRDVKVCLRVAELLRETEIDAVALVAATADTYEEVIWLGVMVDRVVGVNVLYPRDLSWKCAGSQSVPARGQNVATNIRADRDVARQS